MNPHHFVDPREPFEEDLQEVPCECVRCERCDGSGTEHWYLGDEFGSRGTQTCGTCEGTGRVTDNCPLHHAGVRHGR